MRTLSNTLTERQKAKSYIAVCKATLTQGENSYTYDLTRIEDLDHTEGTTSQKAEIILNNSDGALTDLDLKGYKLVLSYGMRTPAGEETSNTAPLYVIGQTLNSQEGILRCTLAAVGLSDILAEDRANASYIPTSTDTKTVKTIINAIMGATLACYSHCPVYEVVWDSEDSLVGTYQPKDSFCIYIGGSRMAAVRRLLDYTKCVGRFGDDGKFHIMVPTTTGMTYDYEYTLSAGHIFFAKAYRKALVIPNYVVVQSRPTDSPQYSGYYTDDDSISSFREVRNYIQTSLTSNVQATAIATAVISKYQMQANMGSTDVPMNCGAELFDYVKVTDSRENDYRVGNIGAIRRYWRKGLFRMTFSFGGWLSVAGLLSNLEVNSDVGSSIGRTTSNGLDLIIDNIQDGDVYAKLKRTHINSEGTLILDDDIYYAAGYDPSTMELEIERGTSPPDDTSKLWIDTSTSPSQIKRWNGTAWVICTPKDLDDLPNGTTYSRIKSASLNASGLVLLDQTVAGTYGLVLSTNISAGAIKLDNIENGTTYSKVLATQISSGKISLSSQCSYAAGYDPSGKRRVFTATPTVPYDLGDLWLSSTVTKRCTTARASGSYQSEDWTAVTLDAITDGSSYARVKATQISSGEIVLSSTDFTLDKNGVVSGVVGSTRVELTASGLQGYNSSTLEFQISATDGKAYFGAGTCTLDASGITIDGYQKALYILGAGGSQAKLTCTATTLNIETIGSIQFKDCDYVICKAGAWLYSLGGTSKLGQPGYPWAELWCTTHYFTGGTYLHVSGGHLYWYDGSTDHQII